MSCPLPIAQLEELKSAGVTDENSISQAYAKNNNYFFDTQKFKDGFREHPLYRKAFDYFRQQGKSDETARLDALRVVFRSLTVDFTANRSKKDVTLEEVLKYEESVLEREAFRKAQIQKKVNSEIFALKVTDKDSNELVLFELDDILGEELYNVLNSLLAQHRNFSKVKDALLSHLEILLVKDNLTDEEKQAIFYLNGLRNPDVYAKVEKWYKNLDRELNNGGLIAIQDEEDTQLSESERGQKTSEKYDKKTVSQIEKANYRLKTLIAALPSIEKVVVIDGRNVREEKQVRKSPTFLLPYSDNTDKSNFNLIAKVLEGARNYEDAIVLLKAKADVYPQLEYLIEYLPSLNPENGTYSTKELAIISNLINTFSLQEVQPWIVNTSLIREGTEEEAKQSTKFYLRSANSTKILLGFYDNRMYKLPDRQAASMVEKGRKSAMDPFKLFKAFDYTPVQKILGLVQRDRTPASVYEELKKNSLSYDRFLEFLYQIGFTEARSLKEGQENYEKGLEFFSHQENLSAGLIVLQKLSFYVQDNRVAYDKSEDKGNFYLENPLRFLATQNTQPVSKKEYSSAYSKKETELGKLAQFFSDFNPESYSPAYFNGANKLEYARPEYFHLLQVADRINKKKNLGEVFSDESLAHFDFLKNPDILGSLWISRNFIYEVEGDVPGKRPGTTKKGVITRSFPTNIDELNAALRDIHGAKSAIFTDATEYKKALIAYAARFKRVSDFKIINFTGMEQLEVKGFSNSLRSVTSDLLAGEKALQDIVAFFTEQVIENPRFGEKTKTLGMMISKPSKYKSKENKYYFPFAKTKDDLVLEKDSTLEPEVAKIIDDYVASEFRRIIQGLRRIRNEVRPQTAAKANKFDANEFTLFFGQFLNKKDIESPAHKEAQEAVNNLVSQVKSMSEEEFNALGATLRKIKDKYVAGIQVNFNAYILSQVEELKRKIERDSGGLAAHEALSNKNFLNLNRELGTPEVKDAPVLDEDNIDYVLGFYLKNAIIHNVEFFKFFHGSLANFDVKKGMREVYKRLVNMSSPGNIPVVSVFREQFAKQAEASQFSVLYGSGESSATRWGTTHSVVFKEVDTFFGNKNIWKDYAKAYNLPENDKAYKAYVDGPKEADAQGVVTLEFYRNYLLSTGSWDAETMDKTYQIEYKIAQLMQRRNQPGADIDSINLQIYVLKDMITTPFPPLKLGHYGFSKDSADRVVYHKFSVVPLLPSTVSTMPEVEPMLEAMYQNGIDYYTFESGSKEDNPMPVQELYVPNPENPNELVFNRNFRAGLTKLDLEDLRELQYQAPKFKKKAILTTQGVKLIFSNQFSDGAIADASPEYRQFLQQQRAKFNNALDILVQSAIAEFDSKIGIQRGVGVNGNIGDIIGFNEEKFALYLSEKFKDDPIIRNYIKLEDGKLVYPIEASNRKDEINLKILNEISKSIISSKLQGDSLIQVAQTPFLGRRTPTLSFDNFKENGAVGFDSGLKFYHIVDGVVQPMEVMVAFNKDKHGALLQLEYNGKKLSEYPQPIDELNRILSSSQEFDKQWVNTHKEKFTYTGVRIPVQGLNSMESMRVKKFLPTSQGSAIVLPPQIVTKSGSDYDIDKLTVYMPTLSRKGDLIESSMTYDEYVANLPRIDFLYTKLKYLQEEATLFYATIETSKDYTFTQKRAFKELKDLVGEAIGRKKNPSRYVSYKVESTYEKLMADMEATIDELERLESFASAAGNDVISVMRDMLARQEIYLDLVKPNDSPVLKEKGEKVEAEEITATDVFSPITSYRIFEENILARNALGIDAKINTMQKQFQMAGLEFSKEGSQSYMFPAHRLDNGGISLSKVFFKNSNLKISDILNEFINGHVDSGKEDWLLRLNMNDVLTPVAHTMLLQGTHPDLVFAFLRQPSVRNAYYNTVESKVYGRQKQSIFSQTVSTTRELIKLMIDFQKLETPGEVVEFLNQEIKGSALDKKIFVELSDFLKKGGTLKDKRMFDASRHFTSNVQVFTEYFNKALSEETKTEIQNLLSTEDGINSLFRGPDNFSSKVAEFLVMAQLAQITEQQQNIRTLTQITDYNTASYANPYSVIITEPQLSSIKSKFNEEGVKKLTDRSSDSPLTNYNLNKFITEIFTILNPTFLNETIIDGAMKHLRNFNVMPWEMDEVVANYSNNAVYTFQALFNQDSKRGNHTMFFFNATDGFLRKGNKHNLATNFYELKENYPDLFNYNAFLQSLADPTIALIDGKEYWEISSVRAFDLEYTTREIAQATFDLMRHHDPAVRMFTENLLLGMYYLGLRKSSSKKIQVTGLLAPLINTLTVRSMQQILKDPQGRENFSKYFRPLVSVVTDIIGKSDSSPFILFSSYAFQGKLSLQAILKGLRNSNSYMKLSRVIPKSAIRYFNDLDESSKLEVYSKKGVNITASAKGEEYDFGNPYEAVDKDANNTTTFESAEIANAAYNEWLRGTRIWPGNEKLSKEEAAKKRMWILQQIASGKLNDKTILYYPGRQVKAGEINAAHVIRDLIHDARILNSGGISKLVEGPISFKYTPASSLTSIQEAQVPTLETGSLEVSESSVVPFAPAKTFPKRNIFTVTPQEGVSDNKAKAKASIATQYIGYGEGIVGKDGKRSSTQLYREQVGALANTGNYSSNDVIFVSIPGQRGDATIAKREQDKTIEEAISAVEAGAIILTDNKSYIDKSSYNTGEKRLYEAMEGRGYTYSETTVDGQLIGFWSKPTQPSEIPIQEAVPQEQPQEEDDSQKPAWELKSIINSQALIREGIERAKKKKDTYLIQEILKANITEANRAVFYQEEVSYPFIDMIYDYEEKTGYEIAENVLFSATTNVGQLCMAYRDISRFINSEAIDWENFETSSPIERVALAFKNRGRITPESFEAKLGYSGIKEFPGYLTYVEGKGGTKQGLPIDKFALEISDEYIEVTEEDVINFIATYPNGYNEFFNMYPTKEQGEVLKSQIERAIAKQMGTKLTEDQINKIINLGLPTTPSTEDIKNTQVKNTNENCPGQADPF